jgi:far upstream element-binding protein
MSNAGDGVEVYEMTIPGSKCGVIIGKGGETIKRLSEQFNVKLVVVQEANTPLNADKPLRITGDRDGVKRAKEAVLELLAPPQDHRPPSKYSTNEYGSRYNGDRGGDRGGDRHGDRGGDRGGDRYGGDRANNNDSYIRVPADRAGVVIGKGNYSAFPISCAIKYFYCLFIVKVAKQ